MILRDPARASQGEYDLIVVGGGIYGACLALEAARRQLRPLLLERGDFGQATSWNSLRILHGGLRYLQTFDLPRFRESVRERRWFCRTFPELVRPLECLMPLYGDGVKRPMIFRAALAINDLLSADRNSGVDRSRWIEKGRMLDAAETVSRFPLADRQGLRGAALWYDATMMNSQRVLIEILRWACHLGATTLNYVEAVAPVLRGGRIVGVLGRDAIDERPYTFASRIVCNCAGPWVTELTGRFGRERADLFRPSLAFNVLLDRDPVCASAVAVAPLQTGRREPTYFLYPAFGRLLAGTQHLPCGERARGAQPSEEDLHQFLHGLNLAVPGLGLRRDDIVRVFAGLLPAKQPETANLAVRPIICDHARSGGPQGLISVAGVKFTTARLVAEKTLNALGDTLARGAAVNGASRPRSPSEVDVNRPIQRADDTSAVMALKKMVAEEAVMTIDDLLFRRTNWAIVERDLEALRCRVRDELGWTTFNAPVPRDTRSAAAGWQRNAAHPA